jgi:hypothetical protein
MLLNWIICLSLNVCFSLSIIIKAATSTYCKVPFKITENSSTELMYRTQKGKIQLTNIFKKTVCVCMHFSIFSYVSTSEFPFAEQIVSSILDSRNETASSICHGVSDM